MGSYGGAIYIGQATANIINNTVVHNRCGQSGKAIYVMGTSAVVKIRNNVFSGNETMGLLPGEDTWDVIMNSNDSVFSFDNNWIEHPYWQEVKSSGSFTFLGDTLHNVTGSDPGFVLPTLTADDTENAVTANFSLKSTSACIDKGDTTGANTGATDYASNARISGTAIDIGAFEFQHSSAGIKQSSAGTDGVSVYPNPTSSVLYIEAKEKVSATVIDVQGKVLLNVTNASLIDISRLASGVYVLQVYDTHGGLLKTEKVVKE